MQVSARNSLLNELKGELNYVLTLIPLRPTPIRKNARHDIGTQKTSAK